jgi:hypothetical protein
VCGPHDAVTGGEVSLNAFFKANLFQVDVMGFMHFWDITIDVVSSIVVIISIGLCVDYASHIAHTFLSTQGNSTKLLFFMKT